MSHRLVVLIVPLLMLVACGGGDRKAPAGLTGELQAGNVQGVAYETPTRSGVTDANGRFTYLPGEIVTFSVGGTVLGSAPGNATITLFTLAGLTPPTTERALRRELDRAMRNSTPFTRASNIALLLIELDADGNPDNGLDVRNRREALAGAPLDFDLPLRAFEYSLYRFVPDVTRNIPPWKPVTWLYGSLGLRVAVHAQTRIDRSTLPQAGTTSDLFTYYANGAIASDGFDGSDIGLGTSTYAYEYDAMGRGTGFSSAEDFDGDGVVDRSQSTSYGFDAHGDMAEYAARAVSPNPGETATWRLVEIARDRFGRTTREVQTIDRDNDGSIDERSTLDASYDTHGNPVTVTWVTDTGDDGHVDARSVTAYVHDARDRVVSQIARSDDDADGTIDSINTSTYSYDSSAAGPTRLLAEVDFDADGVADWRGVYTWTYDRQGNALGSGYGEEPLANGVTYYTMNATRAFDRDRRITEQIREEDWGGNGIPSSRQRDTLLYDDAGNTVQNLSEYDYGADGAVDARATEGSEYGRDGELLMTASGIDFDADGFSEIHATTTPTYVVLGDGVLNLTQWFFRTRFSYVEQ